MNKKQDTKKVHLQLRYQKKEKGLQDYFWAIFYK